jgi:superfamily II DNA/RNA helicase
MKNFNLPAVLQESLARLQFVEPTPIQAKAIPLALDGRDILGSAQTGTGKTGAFVIPTLARILNTSYGDALILTPTRELAAQILKVVHDLLPRKSNIKTALLIGGDSMGRQLSDLRRAPRIVVGTPGRINDHLRRGSLQLGGTQFLILDETDRMLDMGFGVQLDDIMKHMPEDRQTLLFSATLPANIVKLSERYLKDPARVSVGETHKAAQNIAQEMLHLKHSAKYPQLMKELDQRQGSVLIFVKTKRSADQLASQLCEDSHSADAIHGDLRQRERDRVIQAFRNKRHRIMVATDVASRGLDIPHIEHVINYDLPQAPEDYIHRIGRTARAGSSGSAMSFVSPADGIMWREITRLLQGQKMGGEPPPVQFSAQKCQGGNYPPKRGGFGGFKKKSFGRPEFKAKRGRAA